jgi:protein O-GlcNAc transferase
VFFPEAKEQARERLGIPAGKKVVMFIASWINSIPHKGVGAFTEMLSHLYASRNDIFTLVVGHLQGKSVLNGRFEGKETGWVSDPAVLRACYASSDVFVSPTMAENSSCTIMEAMACGAPAVAYATGGVPEQIVHGETGYLVPPGDRTELTRAVESLLQNGANGVAFSAASASRAKQLFSLDRFVEKYLDAYREAINQKER